MISADVVSFVSVTFADVVLVSVIVTVVVAVDDLIGDFILFLPPLQITWVHPSSLLGWFSVSGFVLLLLLFFFLLLLLWLLFLLSWLL